MSFTVPVSSDVPPAPRSSPGAWLAVCAVVCVLMALRIPEISRIITHRVDLAIASGELPDTSQRSLAVTIAVAAAFALSLLVVLVLVTVVRRFETRLRLPAVTIGGRRLGGVLVIVATGLVAKQAASVTFPSELFWHPGRWALALLPLTLAVVLVARQAPGARARNRTAATGAAVGLLILAI